MKSVTQPLAKIFSILLRLTAVASPADAGMHKKILGSGHNTILIISNDEMEDIIKIVKALGDSGLLLEGVSEAIKNEAKEQRGGFLCMLLGTLGAGLLGNMLAGKRIVRAGYVSRRRGIVRAGYGSKQSKKGQGFLFKDFRYHPIL